MIFEHKKGVVSDFGGIPEKIGKTIRCFCERFLPFILIVFFSDKPFYELNENFWAI